MAGFFGYYGTKKMCKNKVFSKNVEGCSSKKQITVYGSVQEDRA